MTKETAPQINNPCPQSWKEMTGDKTKRFCTDCNLHVHNLSELNYRERQELYSRSSSHLCVTYQKSSDGSLISYPDLPLIPRVKSRLRSVFLTLVATLIPFFLSACRTGRVNTGITTKPAQTVEQSSTKKQCERTPKTGRITPYTETTMGDIDPPIKKAP